MASKNDDENRNLHPEDTANTAATNPDDHADDVDLPEDALDGDFDTEDTDYGEDEPNADDDLDDDLDDDDWETWSEQDEEFDDDDTEDDDSFDDAFDDTEDTEDDLDGVQGPNVTEDTDADDVDDTEDTDDTPADDTATGIDKDAVIKKLRKENAARRRQLQETRAQADAANSTVLSQVAEAFQLDDVTDLDTLTAGINQQFTDRERQRDEAIRDLAIFRSAHAAGADVNKLADSKSFTKRLDKLDTYSDSYQADVAKAVASAIEANPDLKAATELDRSGGDFTGGTSIPAATGSVEEIAAQRRKRRGF